MKELDGIKFRFEPSEIYLKEEFFDENGQIKEDFYYYSRNNWHLKLTLKKGTSINEVAELVKNDYLRRETFDNTHDRSEYSDVINTKDKNFIIKYSDIPADYSESYPDSEAPQHAEEIVGETPTRNNFISRTLRRLRYFFGLR